jgi:parallel beta-helix repeat protein
MVQSNRGLRGDYLYLTNNINVTGNTISGSKGAGITFSQASKSIASLNTITGIGFCLSVLSSTDITIDKNTCVDGLGLKNVNSTNVVSDILPNADPDADEHMRDKNHAVTHGGGLVWICGCSLILFGMV